MNALVRILVSCAAIGALAAAEPNAQKTVKVVLASPLTTIVRLSTGDQRGRIIVADITVPDSAPRDLGVGGFVADRHESWFQRFEPQPLHPGKNRVRLALAADDPLTSEPLDDCWGPHAAATATTIGLFFWSTMPCSPLEVTYRIESGTAQRAAKLRLLDLETDDAACRTGERWQMTFSPAPFPGNPYDPSEFKADLVITMPDRSQVSVPAFYTQAMRSYDRGDREEVEPAGGGRFCARFRPRASGAYQITLRAESKNGVVELPLPNLVVSGEPWDDYVKVDANDPRFFAVDGKWHWPIGLNIRSVNDVRCQQQTGTKLTSDRGTLAYDAYLRRFAAAKGNLVEIWMAAWNVGLEWRDDWYGFHGIGRYNQKHAWQLEHILDTAWENGIRVNLVINNHGQASIDHDKEWALNPFNKANGGPYPDGQMLFTDKFALTAQANYRRYIIGRWADHPAIFGWKLWSEFDLTVAGSAGAPWYERATKLWHDEDIYDHPIGTHWSGDYKVAKREIVSLPGIDYNCIDAYHGGGRLLADLIAESLFNPASGMAKYRKPMIITEFGGYMQGPLSTLLEGELPSGSWAGLVTGNGAMPMLWWYEWVDQHDQWSSYGAVARYAAGEDLRGADASSITLSASATAGRLWCRAWCRPGRILGYVLDENWGTFGSSGVEFTDAKVDVGSTIAEGELRIEWWDADKGAIIRSTNYMHTGGPLTLEAPSFKRHLAFKLWRGSR